MKYLIIPAKDVRTGDVIFTNNGEAGKGVQACGRVVAISSPSPHPEITEFRVEIFDAIDEPRQGSGTLGFRHATRLGVARQEDFVDVAAILAEMA